MSQKIMWLSPDDGINAFPDVESALSEPDGLLAAGGDLCAPRLLAAYQKGIFPWYDDGQPILWWSPDPRCILRPGDLQVSKRLGQYARRSSLEVRFNRSFDAVMQACAGERRSQQGTWITAEMLAAYQELHRDGWAHSIEVWDNDDLVGGLYGLCIGRVFFGESMFSAVDNASKFAMLGLTGHMLLSGLEVIDCQVVSPHLLAMGASTVSRRQFTKLLGSLCIPACRFTDWPVDSLPVAETLQIWRSVALH